MKTTAHAFISSATGLGLAAFTIVSFMTAGISAPPTVLGFSFLAVYGLCEMAFIDYTPLRVGGARHPAFAPAPKASATRVIVPAIVEFARPEATRRAAA